MRGYPPRSPLTRLPLEPITLDPITPQRSPRQTRQLSVLIADLDKTLQPADLHTKDIEDHVPNPDRVLAALAAHSVRTSQVLQASAESCSGWMSKVEFVQFIGSIMTERTPPQPSDEDIASLFDKLDQTGSGQITLRQLKRRLGPHV